MSLTFALLGEGAIALRCTQLLQSRGIKPLWLCSPDGSLADVAQELALPHTQDRQSWRQLLAEQRPDVLLSVSNPWILQAQECSLVRRWAINYHDSLLPAHAGMHATSWALLGGDTTHGITWHEVTADIDAGRVAVQVPVAVRPDDTAFSLNLRCYEAAAQGLEVLLDQLAAAGPVWQAQAGQGVLHPARQRVAGQCAILPCSTAQQIDRLVRAHDFGWAHNPMGIPKLWLGGHRWLLVRRVQVTGQDSQPVGALSSRGEGQWVLGTTDGDLVLWGQLHGEAGADTTGPDSLAPVPHPSAQMLSELSTLNAETCLSERYWRQALLTPRQPVAVPGLAAGQHGTDDGCVRPHALPQLDQALAELPSANRFNWALAAWCWLLQGLHAEPESDLAVWHPAAVRSGHGLFATVLPWRLQAQPEWGFTEWVVQVQAQWRVCQQQGTWALDLLHRAPELRQAPAWPASWPAGVWVDEGLPERLGVGWQAVLAIDPSRGACSGLSPQVCEAVWSRLDRALAHLIRSAAMAPDQPLRTLGWLDPEAADRLRSCSVGGDQRWPAGPLHAQVAAQAERTPHAPAIRSGDQVLTYAQLQDRADALSTLLMRTGCVPGERVAWCMAHSPDAVVAMLAVWRVGAVHVPLDAAHPPQRLKAMCVAAGARRLLLHAATEAVGDALLRAGSALRVLMVSAADLGAPGADLAGEPWPGVGDDDLACCIFTSGSTGIPKGVAIAHGGLVNHAWAMSQAYRLGPGQRCLLSASLAFDIAAEQIFPALIAGAEVVVKPPDLLSSLAHFHRFVVDEGLTVLTLPAALWHEWVADLDEGQRMVPPKLATIGVGTEKVSAQALARWQALGGASVRFIQGYGPTEATITCAVHVIDASAPVAPGQPLPVGRPLPNTVLRVLDRGGQPTPQGVEGEICVGGIGLAQGYLGQPELTLQRFQMHLDEHGWPQRLYHTGDRGWWDADGRLVIAGRTDFQVKIRGHRVELGDIEAALMSLPGVHACVATLMDPQGPAPRLVAHIATDGAGPDAHAVLSAATVLQHAQRHLPAHMVPQDVVLLRKLPVGINGKVDRKALPMPTVKQATVLTLPAASAAAAAEDDRVAAAFAEVLGLPSVPRQQGFFDLGGTSLLALRLLSRLERDGWPAVSLATLFAHPSAEALSAQLRSTPPQVQTDRAEALVIQLADGPGQPIWLLGGAQPYQALGRALSGAHPVFAVVLPEEASLAREGKPLPPLLDMARSYVEVLRARTPMGPCAVGGFSFAGVLAHEVARQLLELDGRACTLLLLDTALPSVYGPGAYRQGWMAWAQRQWHVARRGGWAVLAGRARQMLGRLNVASGGGAPRASLDAVQTDIEARRVAAFAALLLSFESVAQPYAGAALIYRALKEDEVRCPVPKLGFAHWLSGNVQEVGLPGGHHDLLATPLVAMLAKDLAQRLGGRDHAQDGAAIFNQHAA